MKRFNCTCVIFRCEHNSDEAAWHFGQNRCDGLQRWWRTKDRVESSSGCNLGTKHLSFSFSVYQFRQLQRISVSKEGIEEDDYVLSYLLMLMQINGFSQTPTCTHVHYHTCCTHGHYHVCVHTYEFMFVVHMYTNL